MNNMKTKLSILYKNK